MAAQMSEFMGVPSTSKEPAVPRAAIFHLTNSNFSTA